MVRLSRSTASWICSIALITTAITLPEQTPAQLTAPSFQATLAAKQFDSAKPYFQKALQLAQKIGLQREQGSAPTHFKRNRALTNPNKALPRSPTNPSPIPTTEHHLF
jgi:hypothetical protein